jgi:hypothetical protein
LGLEIFDFDQRGGKIAIATAKWFRKSHNMSDRFII